MSRAAEDPVASASARPPRDFYVGFAIALFGALLLLWIIPAQVSDAGSFGLPPSLAPKALAWIMTACGAVLATCNLRPSSAGDALKWREVAFAATCLAAVALTLVSMSYLGGMLNRPNSGFLASAPFALLAFTLLHSRPPLWALAFNAVLAPSVIVAAFWWGLELPLP